MTACSVDGCDRRHYGRGLCNMHWRRWREHGDPLTVKPNWRAGHIHAVCSVDGCDRAATAARGWCPMHYKRWRANGDPLTDRRRTRDPFAVCSVDGCDRAPHGRRYCNTHYLRWRRTGDPLVGGAVRHGDTCLIDGCDRAGPFTLGWCRLHYGRYVRNGDPTALRAGGTLEQKLERYSERTAGGCREWCGSLNVGGYGHVLPPGEKRMVLAHRAAWEVANGRKLRPGMVVRHACDNRACIEPTHLTEGTHAENAADKVARGRSGARRGPRRRQVEQLSLL